MSDEAPSEFVDVLDATRRRPRQRLEGDWELARAPNSGTTALIVDVFGSVSHPGRHLTECFSAAALGMPVAAYTYAGFDETGAPQHYLAQDTYQPVGLSAAILAAYLPASPTHAVIPIGASAGAVVALLGTANWMRERRLPAEVLARCVPQVILVAPAISPMPRLYDQYHRRYPDEEPAIIRQLCRIDSEEWVETQQALAAAFGLLEWAGIPVRVVYWSKDVLTPYPWHPRLHQASRGCASMISLSPTDLKLPRRNDSRFEREAGLLHVAFCRHDQTVARVRDFLRNPGTIEPV